MQRKRNSMYLQENSNAYLEGVYSVTCHGYVSTYGTCHKKVSLERPYERLFPFLRYAHICTCQTPVCIAFGHLYPLAHRQSTPVFVKRWISTRRCELFGMFTKRSTCYSCLLSVRAHVCCLLFRVFITACTSQDGVFTLREAENPCLLLLQKELCGNCTMFGG